MANFYQKFLRKHINLADLGIEQSSGHTPYFCTPKGASIIGWSGVDGIHYCFIRGFGESVFAVSPMNAHGDYVHPLANSFSDFLRLLLACGDAAALEQAHRWNQEEFDNFLNDNPASSEQKMILNTISEKLYLEPMDHPFTYIKQLQAEFDYSKIKFTKDYEDFFPTVLTLPEWKVYFDGNFWGHSSRERPGKEIPIQAYFTSNNKEWYVPSIYSCSRGLVIDFCIKILENPIAVNFSPEIILNGKIISWSHASGLSWNPCFPEKNEIESDGACKHYGLDQESGWLIRRVAFPWRTKRKLSISSLSVTIKHDPIDIKGLSFKVNAPGERIEFINPITHLLHTITVHEYEKQEILTDKFADEDYEFPSHCKVMSYTISPDLDDESFTVRDCGNGDRPRKKYYNPMEPQASSDCFAIGIIGGASTPTAIPFTNSGEGKLRAVCSALHFEPVESVVWEINFHKKPCPDMTIKLIGGQF